MLYLHFHLPPLRRLPKQRQSPGPRSSSLRQRRWKRLRFLRKSRCCLRQRLHGVVVVVATPLHRDATSAVPRRRRVPLLKQASSRLSKTSAVSDQKEFSPAAPRRETHAAQTSRWRMGGSGKTPVVRCDHSSRQTKNSLNKFSLRLQQEEAVG